MSVILGVKTLKKYLYCPVSENISKNVIEYSVEEV